MVQWLNRITMSDEVARMTLDPTKGKEKVDFTYINVKTGKETTRKFELNYAILLRNLVEKMDVTRTSSFILDNKLFNLKYRRFNLWH